MLENYPGAKTNSGIIQFLVNNMPAHEVYMELFAGSAQLFRHKRPAPLATHLNDLDPSVIHALRTQYRETYQSKPQLCYYNECAIGFLKQPRCYMRHVFIYLDPTYPISSRRSPTKLYKHEMTDKQHESLLKTILPLDSNIMISTRQNELYDEHLKEWRKVSFNTVTHGGQPATEIIYMNYPPPTLLHQYNYLGKDYIDRQRIKRKIGRFAGKIQALPPHEKHMFILELIENDRDAVQHFLSGKVPKFSWEH